MAGTCKQDNVVDAPLGEVRPIEIVQTLTEIHKFILVATERDRAPFAKIQGEGGRAEGQACRCGGGHEKASR